MRRRAVVVFVTCPTAASARRLAKALLSRRLIACANLLSVVESWYWWEGKIARSREVMLVLKTTADRFDALRRRVVSQHPYQVPEVLAVASSHGHGPYLEWIRSSTRHTVLR